MKALHEASSTPEEFAFRVCDLHKTFGESEVLRGISFDIRYGEKVAVIGPSGSGKTTLFRHLTGVLWPTSGRVRALGFETQRLSSRELKKLRRDIGFLYQSENLIPGLRVIHNVLMGRLGHWSQARALWSLLVPQESALAKEALCDVELEEKLWELPGTLSGGQQQRVAIARLLVQKPKVLLADEPVSSLDIRLGRDVIERLCRVASSRSATLVVSLHSLDLLDSEFDRVLALKEGELFWEGAPGELNQEILQSLYGTEYRALHLDELEIEP